jgi:hypothetical protein
LADKNWSGAGSKKLTSFLLVVSIEPVTNTHFNSINIAKSGIPVKMAFDCFGLIMICVAALSIKGIPSCLDILQNFCYCTTSLTNRIPKHNFNQGLFIAFLSCFRKPNDLTNNFFNAEYSINQKLKFAFRASSFFPSRISS